VEHCSGSEDVAARCSVFTPWVRLWPLTIMQHHVAFEVALDDLFAAPDKLRRVAVTPLGGKREPINEPVVFSDAGSFRLLR